MSHDLSYCLDSCNYQMLVTCRHFWGSRTFTRRAVAGHAKKNLAHECTLLRKHFSMCVCIRVHSCGWTPPKKCLYDFPIFTLRSSKQAWACLFMPQNVPGFLAKWAWAKMVLNPIPQRCRLQPHKSQSTIAMYPDFGKIPFVNSRPP